MRPLAPRQPGLQSCCCPVRKGQPSLTLAWLISILGALNHFIAFLLKKYRIKANLCIFLKWWLGFLHWLLARLQSCLFLSYIWEREKKNYLAFLTAVVFEHKSVIGLGRRKVVRSHRHSCTFSWFWESVSREPLTCHNLKDTQVAEVLFYKTDMLYKLGERFNGNTVLVVLYL